MSAPMLSPHTHKRPFIRNGVHGVSKTRDVTRNILQIESRAATRPMRIAALAAQIQRKARQTCFVKDLAERHKICGRAAEAVHANHRSA